MMNQLSTKRIHIEWWNKYVFTLWLLTRIMLVSQQNPQLAHIESCE